MDKEKFLEELGDLSYYSPIFLLSTGLLAMSLMASSQINTSIPEMASKIHTLQLADKIGLGVTGSLTTIPFIAKAVNYHSRKVSKMKATYDISRLCRNIKSHSYEHFNRK